MRIRYLLLLIIMTFCISVASATTVSIKPVYSAMAGWNMETWSSGTSNAAPDSWTYGTDGLSRSSTSALGSYSAVITGDGTDTRGLFMQLMNLPVGTYHFDAWKKATGLTQGGVSIFFMNRTTWNAGDQIIDSTNSGWEHISGDMSTGVDPNPTLEIYGVNSPNAGSAIYIDGITLSKYYNNISAVEGSDGTHINQAFSWTPDNVHSSAVFVTNIQSYNLNFYTVSGLSCTIDGVSKNCWLAPDSSIYIDMSGLSAMSHNVVVTLTATKKTMPLNGFFSDWNAGTNNVAPDDWNLTDRPGEMYDVHRGNPDGNGDYCLELDGNDSHAVTGHILQKITRPSAFTHLRYRVKNEGVVTGKPQLYLKNDKGNGTYFDMSPVSIPTWTWVDWYTAQPVGTITDAELDIYLSESANTGSKWYIDNVTLTEEAPPSKKLTWKGFDWTIRTGANYPGNELWNISGPYVDAQDRLHLTMGSLGSLWWGSEIDSVNFYKYGIYTFTVEPGSLGLDQNVVLGLFTYYNDENEIDIESAQWHNASLPHLWYTNQPKAGVASTQGVNYQSFDAYDAGGSPIVHQFDWEPTYIHWKTSYLNGTEIANWTYSDPSGVPQVYSKVCMNLWQYAPPGDGQPIDIIIDNFTYSDTSTGPNNYSQYYKKDYATITSPWDFIAHYGSFWTSILPPEFFWGVIILVPYYTIYNRTGRIIIPALLYLFIGGTLGAVMPTFLGQMYYWFLAAGGAGVMYDILIGQQG